MKHDPIVIAAAIRAAGELMVAQRNEVTRASGAGIASIAKDILEGLPQ